MATNDSEVQLLIRAAVEGVSNIGKLINELDALGENTEETGTEAARLAAELDKLKAQQALIQQFDRLEKQLGRTEQQLEEARTRAAELGKEFNSTETPTKRLIRNFNDARKSARDLAQSSQDQRLALQRLRGEIENSGATARNMALNQLRVSKSVEETEEALKGLTNRLKQTRDQAAQRLPDPTRELREGAGSAREAVGELTNELARLASLEALRRFVATSVDAVKQAEASFKGLEAVAEHSGVGIGQAFQSAERLASDGLLSVAEASQGLQNLLSRGYDIEQAEQTLIRLKDAAAFNRAAHLALGEAVVTATDGLKNENSVLVDNAGVTKNVSIIWKEYADSIGKSVGSLTQQEKIQAEVNGILKETEAQAGNAAKALEGLDGDTAQLNRTINEIQTAFGAALIPALQGVTRAGTDVLNNWVKPFLGGIEIMGAGVGRAAAKLELFWDAVFGDGTLDQLPARFAELDKLFEEQATEIVRKWEGGLAPAAQAVANAIATQGEAHKSAAAEANAAAREQERAAAAVADALKALGVDLEQVRTGLSKTEREALGAFRTIAESTEATAEALRASIIAALQEIESPAGLKALQGDLTKLAQSGRLTGADLEQLNQAQEDLNRVLTDGAGSTRAFNSSLDDLKGRYGELTEQTNRLEQAFEDLGVKSAQALSRAADESRTSFAEIERGYKKGEVSLTKVKEAFVAYAKDAVAAAEAAGKPIDPLLKARAAALGLSDELAKLAGTYRATGEEAGIAAAKIAQSGQAAKSAAAGAQVAAEASAVAVKKAKEESASFAAAVGGILNNWQERLGKWSDQARNAFNDFIDGSKAAVVQGSTPLEQALHKTEAALNRVVKTDHGFVGWADRVADKALQIELAFLNEAVAAEKTEASIQKLIEAEQLSAGELAQLERLARSSADQFNLLDQSRLDSLNGAINAAKGKLSELKDEALAVREELEGLGDTLQDEIDRLKGREDAIEQRRYQEQLERIEELADRGGQAASEEAELAKARANELHALRMSQLREQAEERARGQAQSSNATTTQSQPTQGGGSASAQTLKLQFLGPNSGTAVEGFFDERNAAELIRMLGQAGARTIGG